MSDEISWPDGIVVRRWEPDDAESLSVALAESLEHLRPWMAWVAEEPLTPAERRARIEGWERDWRAGGDVMMGIFLAGRVAGGCGLHRRIGPGGLEIGYWVHPAYLRRGLAAAAAARLTSAAFEQPSVDRVEIHHDKDNLASSGVPRKLGYRLLGEMAEETAAPAETGISYRWQMTRDAWRRAILSGRMPDPGQEAPDFTLPDQDGKLVHLADLRGKSVVLYFYPKADTPGCTTQACGVRDHGADYESADAVVLGVSPDPPAELAKFAAKHGLPFTLLGDEDHAVAEAYGVWVEKSMYGRTYMGNERTTFVIDTDGIVSHVLRKVKPAEHDELVLAALAGG